MDDPVDVAWREVQADWASERAHKKFLTLCASLDRLAEAGKRYRAVKDSDPDRAEVASEQIDRLLGLAMQNLQVLKSEPKTRSGKQVLFLIALGISGALVVTAVMAMLRMM